VSSEMRMGGASVSRSSEGEYSSTTLDGAWCEKDATVDEAEQRRVCIVTTRKQES
jgi:hypothetical protein